MKISLLNKSDLNIDVIDHILFEGLEDLGEDGDCIMVLGSQSSHKYRIPKAVALYKAKRAPKLLLCGGNLRETENGFFSEAAIMRSKALEMEIPLNDIILEEVSMNTKENMICALLILERTFKLCNIRKILLVTTTYHMRRSLLMAQTYMPKNIFISPCPADDINTQRSNWFKNEKGYQRAFDEAWKIICYVNEGSIPDFEI